MDMRLIYATDDGATLWGYIKTVIINGHVMREYPVPDDVELSSYREYEVPIIIEADVVIVPESFYIGEQEDRIIRDFAGNDYKVVRAKFEDIVARGR